MNMKNQGGILKNLGVEVASFSGIDYSDNCKTCEEFKEKSEALKERYEALDEILSEIESDIDGLYSEIRHLEDLKEDTSNEMLEDDIDDLIQEAQDNIEILKENLDNQKYVRDELESKIEEIENEWESHVEDEEHDY